MIKSFSKTKRIDAYQFDGNIKELLDYLDVDSAESVTVDLDGKISVVVNGLKTKEGDYITMEEDGRRLHSKEEFESEWDYNEPVCAEDSVGASFDDMVSSWRKKDDEPWYTLMYCARP